MAKFVIWIVEDSGELTKACLKYAVDKVFQNDGHQSYCPMNPCLMAMSFEKFCDKALRFVTTSSHIIANVVASA